MGPMKRTFFKKITYTQGVRFNVSKIYTSVYKDKHDHCLTRSKKKKKNKRCIVIGSFEWAFSNSMSSQMMRFQTVARLVQKSSNNLHFRSNRSNALVTRGGGFPYTGKHTRISFAYLNT